MLCGAGAIAVPIVLHLIMRQKPKLLEFPALRFIQRRHDHNQRRLRLRHLLLLLLRAAAIAMLALALARPSIKFSQRFGSQEAPVAAALIFDAAPHMQYRRDKKTRLEAAQEIGQWLLQQLPPESQIAVCDSGMAPQSFDADRGLSKQRIGNLDIVPNPRPLTHIVGEAARVLEKSELQAKEIYVFTDLSRASWPAEDAAYLQDRLREISGVSVYLIDVGVTDPNNFALGDLNLSHQVVAAGASVDIQTEISCHGHGRASERWNSTCSRPREIAIDLRRTGQRRRTDQAAPHGRVAIARFPPALAQAGHAAGAREDRGAGPAGRRRRALFHGRGPPPLAGADRGAAADGGVGLHLNEALAPAERKHGTARFVCDTIDYGELAGRSSKGWKSTPPSASWIRRAWSRASGRR